MMSDRNSAKRYVFGAALVSTALGGVPSLLERANAQLVTNAQFTFENVNQTIFPSSGTGSASYSSGGTTGTSTFVNYNSFMGKTVGSFTADSGTGVAHGVHQSSSTVWSTPSGNGSPRSLSANNWSANDYYEFDVPTTNLQNIIVSFDQASSSTGPPDFELVAINVRSQSAYSLGTYAAAVGTFVAGSSNSAFAQAFSITGSFIGTALNNNSSVQFLIIAFDTGAASSWAGTDEIDNFTIAGNQIVSSPEPPSLALAGFGVAGFLLHRRTRKIRTSIGV
jgi:hypothetical protein